MSRPSIRLVHPLQPGPVSVWSNRAADGEPMASDHGSFEMRKRMYVDQICAVRGWDNHELAMEFATSSQLHEYGAKYGIRWFVHKDKSTGRWRVSRRFFYLHSKRPIGVGDHDAERDTSANG